MKVKVLEVLEWVFSILLAVGLCLACTLNLAPETPVSKFLIIYGIIFFMILGGAFGLAVCKDPHYYLGMAYGAWYAIVNNVRILFAQDLEAYMFRQNSLVNRYYLLYDEGIERYDTKHNYH